MKKNHIYLLLLLTLVLFPVFAGACPMCQGGTSKNMLSAYRIITLLLALLPILGGTGIFYWIYLKNKPKKTYESK